MLCWLSPIGLRLTSIVARIVMDSWAREFLKKLVQARVDVHAFVKYVDDINLVMLMLDPGTRWTGSNLEMRAGVGPGGWDYGQEQGDDVHGVIGRNRTKPWYGGSWDRNLDAHNSLSGNFDGVIQGFLVFNCLILSESISRATSSSCQQYRSLNECVKMMADSVVAWLKFTMDIPEPAQLWDGACTRHTIVGEAPHWQWGGSGVRPPGLGVLQEGDSLEESPPCQVSIHVETETSHTGGWKPSEGWGTRPDSCH